MKSRVVVIAVLAAATLAVVRTRVHARPDDPTTARSSTAVVARKDFLRTVRLSGSVEAVQATTMAAPRLAGQNNSSLVIMRLIKNGTTVRPGDMLVEFDRQDQLRNALDNQAQLTDFEQQIRKRQADEAAARASDDSTLEQARSALSKAKLELVKNDMLPKIEAEKNSLAAEAADAQLKQLQETYDLKRRAAEADIRILEIQRDRAGTTMKQAQTNAEKMLINSTIAGVAVLKTTWKNSGLLEYTEGDEVRSGQPVVEVVNPAVMRVRARVNQADMNDIRAGQPVRIGLDAYPQLAFTGVVDQISPIGSQSTLNPKVRTFVILVLVHGANPNLMPDLTASLDVELQRIPRALTVPRDAVLHDGTQDIVEVQRGGRLERQAVTVGPANANDIVVTSGLQEGVTVARNPAGLVK